LLRCAHFARILHKPRTGFSRELHRDGVGSRVMILSILLTSVLTAILVCPLLATSAIHRL